MSNLLKHHSVVMKSTDKLVIDSNNIINEMLKQREALAQVYNSPKEPDEDGFVCGLDAAVVEKLIGEPIEEDVLEIESVDVNEQIAQMLEEARIEAETIRSLAREEGYRTGLTQGRQEQEELLNQLRQEQEALLEEQKIKMMEEYEELKKGMEAELVDTLLEVFSRFTHTMADNKKDMILHLIDGVMRNSELSREFLIRVCEEDYKFLLNSKELIYGATSDEIHIDICKDSSLERNQCIIETDSGVFDCSLDIQLENLIKDIRLLSCMNK